MASGSVAAGLAAAAVARLAQQLMPGTEAVEWTTCAGFLLGTAFSWGIVHAEKGQGSLTRAAVVVLVAAIGCALPIVLFQPLTDLFHAATSTVSTVSAFILIR